MDFSEAMDCDLFAHRKVRDCGLHSPTQRRVLYPETANVPIEHGDSDFCLTWAA
jgi:hypothetical protein